MGTLLLNAGIGAGAEEILIPEENLGLDRLLESLQKVKLWQIIQYCCNCRRR
jgi:6-phosphofructokinase 1